MYYYSLLIAKLSIWISMSV